MVAHAEATALSPCFRGGDERQRGAGRLAGDPAHVARANGSTIWSLAPTQTGTPGGTPSSAAGRARAPATLPGSWMRELLLRDPRGGEKPGLHPSCQDRTGR